MGKAILLFILCVFSLSLYGQVMMQTALDTAKAKAEIIRLYEFEERLTIHQDTNGMKKYYPEDFVVTNPFNQFINKSKVLERVRSNIIKYTAYKHTFDAFRFYGNVAVVIGSEHVMPAGDANRADAGRSVNRRFTEMWVLRNQMWQKVVRHASNITDD